jgi:hypothetical protein
MLDRITQTLKLVELRGVPTSGPRPASLNPVEVRLIEQVSTATDSQLPELVARCDPLYETWHYP